jgi:hypothetical protein
VIQLLNSLQDIDEKNAETVEFKQQMQEIADFTKRSDSLVAKLVEADENWFGKMLMKLMK